MIQLDTADNNTARSANKLVNHIYYQLYLAPASIGRKVTKHSDALSEMRFAELCPFRLLADLTEKYDKG